MSLKLSNKAIIRATSSVSLTFQAPDLNHVIQVTRQEIVWAPRVACQAQNFIAVPAFMRNNPPTFQAPDLDHVVHATRQETVGMPRVACQCQNFIAVPAFTRDDEHTAPRLQIPQPGW
eukprot:572546-Pelagomonas_calceolata.AAC.1